MKETTLNIDFVRDNFPALKKDFIFMDNAGGSQTLGLVINRITDFLTHYDVQLGASYEVSAAAGIVLDQVHRDLADLINVNDPREIISGPSTTMLLRIC